MRYPGQRYDSVSGLHYNYFRDYDPGTGRYVQSDPVGLDGGINSFGYVGGNPLNRLDAFGLCECKAVSTDAGSQGTGVHYVSPRWFGKFGSVHNVTCTYECRRNPGDEADIIRAEHEERYITSPDWDNGMEGTCLGTNFSAVYDHNRNKTIYSPLNALPFDPADGDNRGFQSPDLKKWAENNCPECNRGILFRDFNRKKP
jgi:RHS repeat-associated protein